MSRRHGWRFWAGIAAGGVVGLPVALMVAALAVLNTDAGQGWAARLAGRLSGGTVRIAGLHGRVPDRLRVDTIELRDGQGIWLSARTLALDWSPLALLGGLARITMLKADAIALGRLPQGRPGPAKPGGQGFKLPVAVDLRSLTVDDLALGAALTGAPAHLAVSGTARLSRLDRGRLHLALRRTDASGIYGLDAAMTGRTVHARLDAEEAAGGLVSSAVGAVALGAVAAHGALDGPWNAAGLNLTLAAGALRAASHGTLDLPGRAARLRLTVQAPAMAPAPGVGWDAVAIDAGLTGPWARPVADGTVRITGLVAGGARIGRIDGRLNADTRLATLAATATGLQPPPPNAGMLGEGALRLQAQMRLDDPARPIRYAFEHPMADGQGEASLRPLRARLAARVPSLEPLAQARGRDVAGSAELTLALAQDPDRALHVDLDAAMAITGGADAPASARGTTTLGASVTLAGETIVLSRLDLVGTTLHASATGERRNGQVSARWRLAASDLAPLVPALRGSAAIQGTLNGTQQDFAAAAVVDGSIGTATLAPGAVHLALQAAHLPDRPQAHMAATAMLAGAPLTLDVDLGQGADGGTGVAIHAASWKSARIGGALSLAPGAARPVGQLRLSMARLEDLRPVLGRAVAGSLEGTADLPATGAGRIMLTARGAGQPGTARVDKAVLDLRLAGAGADATINGTLSAAGLQAGAIGGDLRVQADGTRAALGLRLSGALHGADGVPATMEGVAMLQAEQSRLRLDRFSAVWRGARLALKAPATLTYAPGLAVDRLVVGAVAPGAAAATATVGGRFSPVLDATLTARDLTPALAAAVVPSLAAAGLAAEGVVAVDARLSGSLAAPGGTLRLVARGLHQRAGPGRGLPAIDATAEAVVQDGVGRITAALNAGAETRFSVRGTVPVRGHGPMDLRLRGGLDLAMLDPILAAAGRRVRGVVAVDGGATGSLDAPMVQGTVSLTGGEVQDFGLGVHVTDLAATIAADGKTIRVARFTGRAGGGTLGMSGTVGLGGAMPVALSLTARDARPVNSDLISATLDADLALAGEARGAVSARGRIHVRRADIQIPDRLPASVVVLDVRRPGAAPVPPARGAGPSLPLDITLDAPQQVFVRGRGLDAELGGSLHVGGTAAAPLTAGSIDLRSGSYSLAGTTLTFTSGDISFNGARRIDPALNLVATSATPDITATLTVGGYASAPKITLTSVPDRPQDEVLAALLFHQSAASLSPFQLAQIAAALAQVSGVGGGGPDPIARLRKGLGLDRLGVASSSGASTAGGAGSGTSTTAVEGGRYVAPGVFVGAKQGISGSQTAAEVQIDLTRRLKLNTTVGSGTGGNSLGLTYQFQY